MICKLCFYAGVGIMFGVGVTLLFIWLGHMILPIVDTLCMR